MATIRTADNPRVLGTVLRVSGQLKLRASPPAYLQFEQGRCEYVAGPGSCRQAAKHKAGRRSGSFQRNPSLFASFTYAYHPQWSGIPNLMIALPNLYELGVSLHNGLVMSSAAYRTISRFVICAWGETGFAALIAPARLIPP
jgi:hypothetical protein